MSSASERRRYIVTSSLIGWAHTQNDLSHNDIYFYCNTEAGSNIRASLWQLGYKNKTVSRKIAWPEIEMPDGIYEKD